VDDAFVAEVARRSAATTTLANIERACVSGIPRAGQFLAANTVIESYLSATPLPSPITTNDPKDTL
jgi:hypothetical protein